VRIAVIGSGIAGLGAAWALSRAHDVTVYEAADRGGGHAHTVDVDDAGRRVAVDTGFIVYNELNYPNLVRLFEAIGVPTEASDMSFSVSIGEGAFEYQARLRGLVAQPSNLLRPSFLAMTAEIFRFTREARELLGSGSRASIGTYLDRRGYSRAFREDYLLPMVACIWSSELEAMLDFPAEAMVRFLENHGLLQVRHRPQWRTVTGGSREYVRRLIADGPRELRLSTPVASIARDDAGVTVADTRGGLDRFDHVVMATHADTSLRLLGDGAMPEESNVLASFGYQRNTAVLHRDPSLMPIRRAAWSSWNYLASGRGHGGAVSLSYWMNRLQNLETERPIIVTLNPGREPRDVVATFTYDHPRFDGRSIEAQADLPTLQGRRRTWFAGAYHGFGFHEDGLRSGLEVAARLGSPAPWWPGSSRPLSSGHRSPAMTGVPR
jgi:uncharacterized protein